MRAIEREPVEAELAHRGGDREPLDEPPGGPPLVAQDEGDEVAGEEHGARARGQDPQQRGAVGAHEELLERPRAVADGADRRVDRRGDDGVGAIDVARERRGERDEADPFQAAIDVEGEDLSLGDDERRDERDEDGHREAQVAPRHGAVVAQRQAIGRGGQRGDDAREVAGRRADDEAPHAHAGRGERDGDREGDHRHHGLQQALARVVHAAEEDPRRRLQREGQRQVGGGGGQRQQPVVVVHRGHHRRRRPAAPARSPPTAAARA